MQEVHVGVRIRPGEPIHFLTNVDVYGEPFATYGHYAQAVGALLAHCAALFVKTGHATCANAALTALTDIALKESKAALVQQLEVLTFGDPRPD